MENQTVGISPQALRGIMTDEDYLLTYMVKTCACLVLAILGIFTNSVCIKVFLAMKTNDAVSIGFLGLAWTDLVQSFCTLAHNIFAGLFIEERLHGLRFMIDPFMILIFMGNVTICVTEVTILITLYLAIARCVCIAFPLRFRYGEVFTGNRTRLVITGAWMIAVSTYTPIFAHTASRPVHHPTLNATRFIIWFSPDRERIKDAVYMFAMIVLTFATQVILVICIIVMSRTLLQARRFRQSSSTQIKETSDNNGNFQGSNSDQQLNASKSSSALSGKELQAVKQVVIICIIFVLCNTPSIVVAVTSTVVPGFEASTGSDRFVRVYITSHEFKRLVEQINSTVNVFIYYRFNTRFRESCSALPKAIENFIALSCLCL